LFPPGCIPPGVRDPNETWVDEKEDGYDKPNAPAPLDWLSQYYNSSLPGMIECVQHAGELIFVPTGMSINCKSWIYAVIITKLIVGWWHMVLNLEDTISVTQNVANRYNWNSVWKDISHNHKDLAEKFRNKLQSQRPELLS